MDEFSYTGKKKEVDTFFDLRKMKLEADKIICRELVKFSYFYEQILLYGAKKWSGYFFDTKKMKLEADIIIQKVIWKSYRKHI